MGGIFPDQRTSTSTTAPDPAAQRIAGMAFEAGEQVPLNFDGRLTGAGINPDQTAGLQSQRDALSFFGPEFGQNIIALGNQLANPSLNPLLPGAIEAASRPVLEAGNFANQELLRGAEQFGAAGGSAVRQAQTEVAGGTQRQLSDLASQLAFATSESALNRSLQAPGVLNAGFGLTQLPGQQLSNIGDAQQDLDSVELNENLAQFRESQTAPFAALRQIAEILGLVGQRGSSTTNVTQLDQFTQFLQAALGLGQLCSGQTQGRRRTAHLAVIAAQQFDQG